MMVGGRIKRAVHTIVRSPSLFPLLAKSRLTLPNPYSTAKEDIEVVVIKKSQCATVWGHRLFEASLEEDAVIGLDVEWRPVFRKGQPNNRASVLQLSGPGLCLIMQLLQMDSIPPLIHNILADPVVVKVGVQVRSDLAKLQTDHGLEYKGYHDVGLIGGRVLRQKTFQSMGMVKLVKALYDVKMQKETRLSDWEQRELTTRQVEYAALDAIASREIFLEFRRQGHLDLLEERMRTYLASGTEEDHINARSLARENDLLWQVYWQHVGKQPYEKISKKTDEVVGGEGEEEEKKRIDGQEITEGEQKRINGSAPIESDQPSWYRRGIFTSLWS